MDALEALIAAGIVQVIPVGYEGDDAKEKEEAGE
jgi:hypothetical protein